MTPGPVEAYLQRLARQLRQRGLEDARMVEEAREHLADAVADGRERGLSVEDAEREAFERFGAPDIVAAHVVPAEDSMWNGITAVSKVVWHRKWWILAPTVVTAIVTSVMSFYFLPTRYRSEVRIQTVAAQVPPEYVRPPTDRFGERVQNVRQQVLSRTKLEKMITDFGLYQEERKNTPIDELVLQMRDDIHFDVSTSEGAQDADLGRLTVSFVSSEPQAAMRVTERLAMLIVQEALQDRELLADATAIFIDSEVFDVRRRLIEYEARLEDLRDQNGRRPLSQAHLLPYEVLQDQYKALLIQSEQVRIVRNLERRQIGPRLRVLDGARLPDRPVGPTRLGVNVAGTFLGLGLGIVAIAVRGRSKNGHSPA